MLAKGSTRTTWNKQQKFDLLFDNCTFAHFSLHVFISYLDSQSDGTHWLQRIHKWAIDVMLHFSKSVHMKKQIHLHLGWPEWVNVQKCSFLVNYSFKFKWREENKNVISGNSHLPFCVHLQDVHHVNHDVLVRLLVFSHPERYSQPSWTTCAHMFLPSLFFPFSHLKNLNSHILLKPDCIEI